MDLTTGHVEPYRKPNDVIAYVHAKSNHPPAIIKQIPKTVQNRLSNISSTKEIFEAAVQPYQNALDNAGYKAKLSYEPRVSTGMRKSKRNQRKILYFNPPYNKNVVTNVGKTILNSIKRHIPEDHTLHKILNKNTVKVSYSCMPNLEKIIKSHNAKIERNEQCNLVQDKTCNCRRGNICPFGGECVNKELVYEAHVHVDRPNAVTKVYYGLTCNTFKTRHNRHNETFRKKKFYDETELSKYLWKLKEKNINFRTEWKLKEHARPFKPGDKFCSLCNAEKKAIILGDRRKTLNKLSEFIAKCRHKKKYMLSSIDYGNHSSQSTTGNKIIQTKDCFVKIKRLKLPDPPKVRKCTVRLEKMKSPAKAQVPLRLPVIRRSSRGKIPNTLYDLNTWSK